MRQCPRQTCSRWANSHPNDLCSRQALPSSSGRNSGETVGLSVSPFSSDTAESPLSTPSISTASSKKSEAPPAAADGLFGREDVEEAGCRRSESACSSSIYYKAYCLCNARETRLTSGDQTLGEAMQINFRVLAQRRLQSVFLFSAIAGFASCTASRGARGVRFKYSAFNKAPLRFQNYDIVPPSR